MRPDKQTYIGWDARLEVRANIHDLHRRCRVSRVYVHQSTQHCLPVQRPQLMQHGARGRVRCQHGGKQRREDLALNRGRLNTDITTTVERQLGASPEGGSTLLQSEHNPAEAARGTASAACPVSGTMKAVRANDTGSRTRERAQFYEVMTGRPDGTGDGRCMPAACPGDAQPPPAGPGSGSGPSTAKPRWACR